MTGRIDPTMMSTGRSPSQEISGSGERTEAAHRDAERVEHAEHPPECAIDAESLDEREPRHVEEGVADADRRAWRRRRRRCTEGDRSRQWGVPTVRVPSANGLPRRRSPVNVTAYMAPTIPPTPIAAANHPTPLLSKSIRSNDTDTMSTPRMPRTKI